MRAPFQRARAGRRSARPPGDAKRFKRDEGVRRIALRDHRPRQPPALGGGHARPRGRRGGHPQRSARCGGADDAPDEPCGIVCAGRGVLHALRALRLVRAPTKPDRGRSAGVGVSRAAPRSSVSVARPSAPSRTMMATWSARSAARSARCAPTRSAILAVNRSRLHRRRRGRPPARRRARTPAPARRATPASSERAARPPTTPSFQTTANVAAGRGAVVQQQQRRLRCTFVQREPNAPVERAPPARRGAKEDHPVHGVLLVRFHDAAPGAASVTRAAPPPGAHRPPNRE